MNKRLNKKPSQITTEIGVSNIHTYGGTGYLLEDDLLSTLSGSRGALTYRQMAEGSPVVGAILYCIRMFLDGVQWRIDPDDTESAKKNKPREEDVEFIQEAVFNDMQHSFPDLVSNSLTMLVFGFSISEVVYKIRTAENSKFNDGRIGIAKVAHRPQESIYRWLYDKSGELVAFEQYTNTGEGVVRIPINKCVHFRATTDRATPEGRSILRNAYRSWYFGRNIERIEAVGIERELAGLPIVTIPNKILEDAAAGDPEAIATRNSYLDISKNVRLNEQAGLLLPSDTYLADDGSYSSIPMVDLKLVSSSGQRSIDTNTIITRHETNIARSMMADFLMLGSSGGGSYALGKDKSSLFEHCLRGWLSVIKYVVQRQLVTPLWVLNGLPLDKVPYLEHSPTTRESLEEFSSSIERLARSGMELFPSDSLEEFVRERFNWPALTEEEKSERKKMMSLMAQEQNSSVGASGRAAGTDSGTGGRGRSK